MLAHLKDVDARLASRVRRGEVSYQEAVGQGLYQPLGDGDVDVASVVRELEASGYRDGTCWSRMSCSRPSRRPATGPPSPPRAASPI